MPFHSGRLKTFLMRLTPILMTTSRPQREYNPLLGTLILKSGPEKLVGLQQVVLPTRCLTLLAYNHTGGTNYGAAIAGTQNAASFYQKTICTALTWGVNLFCFEAFDEPWKPASIGDNGASADETHWGVMTGDRQVKFPLQC